MSESDLRVESSPRATQRLDELLFNAHSYDIRALDGQID
jgi:hypothetical protein